MSCSTKRIWTGDGVQETVTLATTSDMEKRHQDTREMLTYRQKTHGEYSDHALITQTLKGCMRTEGWFRLRDDQRESLDMIAHKIGRILAGNPNVRDHWADIAGYATLSADLVKKE